MWKKVLLLSSCCLGGLICWSVNASSEVPQSLPVTKGVDVEKINSAMLEIFALTFQNKDYKNTLMSPCMLQNALGMLYAGASGKYVRQLEEKIGFDDKYFDYQKSLHISSNEKSDSSDCLVSSMNMVAMSGIKRINEEFERRINESFRGVIVLFPNGGQKPLIRKVNNFVARKTNKLITNFLPQNSLANNGENIILLNMLTFRGVWQAAFDTNDTKREKFTTPWGESIVNIMHRTGRYRYFANDLATGVEIPYADENLVMNILMPTQMENDAGFSNLARITRELPKKLKSFLASGKEIELELSLPRFVIRGGDEYVGILKKFGVTEIFEPGVDWSKICGDNFLIADSIIQQTVLIVDESGSRGVSSSAAMSAGSAAGAERPIGFKVNRPFVVLIRDTKRNLILLAAAVVRL